jgi:hypothetical protein
MIEFTDAYDLIQSLRSLNVQAAHRVKEGESSWTAEHVTECKKIKHLTDVLIDVLWAFLKP